MTKDQQQLDEADAKRIAADLAAATVLLGTLAAQVGEIAKQMFLLLSLLDSDVVEAARRTSERAAESTTDKQGPAVRMDEADSTS